MSTNQASNVEYMIKNGIAYITINRPEAMNALNPTVVAQLKDAFTKAENDADVKGIAFCGTGKAFIAGADIKYFLDNIKAGKIEDNVAFTVEGHNLFRRIETCKKPTVAVVAGLSLGGGSELALACQAIVGTEEARFAFPETGIGIYPGLGGMIRAARIFGHDLAKYYMTTGKTIRAGDAKALGVITRMTDIAGIETAVENIVSAGAPDKYADPTAPAEYAQMAASMAGGGMYKLLSGEIPAGVDEDFAKTTASILSSKSLVALKFVDELMDAQAKVSIDEAIQLEIGKQFEMYSTKDALTGLSAPPGQKVVFS